MKYYSFTNEEVYQQIIRVKHNGIWANKKHVSPPKNAGQFFRNYYLNYRIGFRIELLSSAIILNPRWTCLYIDSD